MWQVFLLAGKCEAFAVTGLASDVAVHLARASALCFANQGNCSGHHWFCQEFNRRQFLVKWCVVSGQMAGFHACSSADCCNGASSVDYYGLKVKRERVFILACKEDRACTLFEAGYLRFTFRFHTHCVLPSHLQFWQGIDVMSSAEIEAEAHKCHHFRAKPRLSTWLTNDRRPDDVSRLRACGNIVIPQMAQVAVSLLAKL